MTTIRPATPAQPAREIAPTVNPIADLSTLFSMITATRPASAWPTIAKCQALAALVVAQRARVIGEIGVWTGDSLIPMLLAQKLVAPEGVAYAIDPWSPVASIDGQDGANLEWWAKVDHDEALAKFQNRLSRLELMCHIVRQPADQVDPAPLGPFDVLHIDGNHGEQAFRDVERFGTHVALGGWLVLDDLAWAGGHVTRARDRARELGFADRYPLDNGCAMQRTSIR